VCLVFELLDVVFLISDVGAYVSDYGVELIYSEHFEDEWASIAWVHG